MTLKTKKNRDLIDFGHLPVGYKKPETIWLKNDGDYDVEINIGLLS